MVKIPIPGVAPSYASSWTFFYKVESLDKNFSGSGKTKWTNEKGGSDAKLGIYNPDPGQ
jgi:hypothetical protein